MRRTAVKGELLHHNQQFNYTPRLIGCQPHALGVVARAKGMAQIASQTGLSREQLYRSFSEKGNPTLKTTLAVMKALGVELTTKASAAA